MRTKLQSCLTALWLTKQLESAGGLQGTATILETLLLPFPLVYLVGHGKYMMVQNHLKSSGFLFDNDSVEYLQIHYPLLLSNLSLYFAYLERKER